MQINPGTLLLLKGLVGSQAFGLANETSDKDYLGIYAAPTVMFHGLDKVQESFVFKNPDTTYHEAGKYCRLALKCNPTILDLLWVNVYNVRSRLGTELVNMRNNFLSEKYVRNSYIGYAVSQLGKLTQSSKAKQARHMYRLLHQGYELYTTGNYSLRLADPEKFIAFGEKVSFGDVLAAKDLLNEYANKFDSATSVLPEKPNQQPIEEWLRKVRHELYQYGYRDSFENLEKFEDRSGQSIQIY